MKKIKTLFGTGGLRILLPVVIVSLGLLGCANNDGPGDGPGDVFGGTSQAAMPTFDPVGGAYDAEQTITIITTTEGASIRYTTDGTIPSSATGIEYAGAVSVGEDATIKAIAYKDGMNDSTVAEAAYTFQTATPTFDPVEGSYSTTQTVTISTVTSGASIRYTTDGTAPTATVGTEYSTAISVSATTTIKAIAYKSGMPDSAVASATYTITLTPVDMPTFNPLSGGTFTSAQTITISTGTSGATIKYTTDGSDPLTGGTGTEGATVDLNNSGNYTIMAYAYKAGMADSPVATATYTVSIPNQIPLPTFTVTTGTYLGTFTVDIDTTESGATILYTTDGTSPGHDGSGNPNSGTTAGPAPTISVSISATTNLRAKVYKATMTDSGVVSVTYTIDFSAPSITAAVDGSYPLAQDVVVSTSVPGTTITYTTDGTDPAAGGTSGVAGSSTATFRVKDTDKNLQIRAIATKLADVTTTTSDELSTTRNYIITRVVNGAYVTANLATFDIIIEAATGWADSGGGQATYESYRTNPGHIPGAIYLHTQMSGPGERYIYENWSGGGSTNCTHGRVGAIADFQDYGTSIGLTSSSKVLIYGDFSTESLFWVARAFWVFDYYGVEVYWLDGGKAAYTGAGGSLDTGVFSATSGAAYTASPDSTKIALEGEVTATRDDTSTGNDVANQVFFEARGSTAYTGNPYNASHIPGAENVLESLNYDGSYILKTTIPPEYLAAGITDTTDNIVYCGTGSVASGSYLYLKFQGYRIRNYAGSMHEWDTCLGRTVVSGSSPY